MKSQCLPFRQIPHSTPLFNDFLSWSPSIQPFYSRSPHFAAWLKDEAPAIRYDSVRREQVTGILERQNKAWGASPRTLENIARLRGGASAVVTGQQVGLFGGPLFSLFKALTTVKLANEASSAGCDSVPVFWLATEDHDFNEVAQIALPAVPVGFEHVRVRGISDERDAQVESALLSARECLHTCMPLLVETDETDHLADVARMLVVASEHAVRLVDREVRPELGVLQHHPDALAEPARRAGRVVAEHLDLAAVAREQL